MDAEKVKEYWRKLQEEFSPQEYRDCVLCDPLPEADQAHLDSIRDHFTKVDKKV